MLPVLGLAQVAHLFRNRAHGGAHANLVVHDEDGASVGSVALTAGVVARARRIRCGRYRCCRPTVEEVVRP